MPNAGADRRTDPRADVLARAGVLALALGALLILLLQLVPPTDEISALHRTISEYGLSGNKWMFDLALILVATGSATGFAALRLQNRVPVLALVLGAAWTLGLLVILAFPKHDWRVDPTLSTGGTLHRVASIVAFVCLPLAVLFSARRAFPRSPGRRLAVRLLAVGAFAWLAVIVGAVVVAVRTGQDWWLITPYGLEERGLAATELLALAFLVLPVRPVTAGQVLRAIR